MREKAEAMAREKLARTKELEARVRHETEIALRKQEEAERLFREQQLRAFAAAKKQDAKEEQIRTEANARLERVEKSLAELIELQKSLVKSLAEKEQRGAGSDTRKE